MNEFDSIAYADIGNSRIKILSGEFFNSFVYDENVTHELQKLYKINRINKIYYSSVNADFEKIFLTLFDQTLEIINISTLIENQRIIDFSKITGMGIDRKLSLFGGLSLTSPISIVIDCGTAITINVLDLENVCLGGIIFPGINLQERSLREMTNGLKHFNLYSPEILIGKSTSEAISIGLFHGISNSIAGFVSTFKNVFFANMEINIVLTGGSAVLILPFLEKQFRILYEEKLNLLGMKYLIKNLVENDIK